MSLLGWNIFFKFKCNYYWGSSFLTKKSPSKWVHIYRNNNNSPIENQLCFKVVWKVIGFTKRSLNWFFARKYKWLNYFFIIEQCSLYSIIILVWLLIYVDVKYVRLSVKKNRRHNMKRGWLQFHHTQKENNVTSQQTATLIVFCWSYLMIPAHYEDFLGSWSNSLIRGLGCGWKFFYIVCKCTSIFGLCPSIYNITKLDIKRRRDWLPERYCRHTNFCLQAVIWTLMRSDLEG